MANCVIFYALSSSGQGRSAICAWWLSVCTGCCKDPLGLGGAAVHGSIKQSCSLCRAGTLVKVSDPDRCRWTSLKFCYFFKLETLCIKLEGLRVLMFFSLFCSSRLRSPVWHSFWCCNWCSISISQNLFGLAMIGFFFCKSCFVFNL